MDNQTLPSVMVCAPCVFAIEDRYQIYSLFCEDVIMQVRVGERTFYDDCCGILRSGNPLHRVELPMSVLDAAGSYTVVFRKVVDRRPYFPILEDACEYTVTFRPVPTEGDIHIYHVADAHNLVEQPVAAGRYFGEELHLLVLNGDIPNDSSRVEHFHDIYRITAGITGGQCAAVFARGNHDTRGICAEEMPNYIPVRDGKTYYTFRAGPVWGLVLDCGEDKDDGHPEYGGTVCFHEFRLAQTDYIRSVIHRAASEYEDAGVKFRLVISHNPFCSIHEPPFDIEQELFGQWARLLREHICPTLLLHGHKHTTHVIYPGKEGDDQGLPCPAVIGSAPTFGAAPAFVGAALTLGESGITVAFTDDRGEVKEQRTL